MPIKFRCMYCGQLLGIARRKAGTVVACPKCDRSLTVPLDTEAERGRPIAAPLFEAKQFDEWIQGPGPRGVRAAPAPEPISSDDPAPFEGPATPRPASASSAPNPLPSPAVLLGTVMVLVLVSFGLGTLFGRYVVPASPSRPAGVDGARSTASAQPAAEDDEPEQAALAPSTPALLVEGAIRYSDAGKSLPDDGATVLIFPQKEKPKRLIQTLGLLPEDRARQDKPGRDELVQLGGQLGYVEPDGSYRVALGQPGTYWVLVVSKNRRRGENDGPFDTDYQILREYFGNVLEMLRGRDYMGPVIKEVEPGKAAKVDWEFRD